MSLADGGYPRPWTAALPGRAAAALLLLGLLGPVAAPAQDSAREAEQRLQKLRSELKDVGRERQQIEGQRGEASRQLREADAKVARSSRVLEDTGRALASQQQALQEAEQRHQALQQRLATQRRELAQLLNGAYRVGNDAPLKLLLSQDKVADANRVLAYHRYVQAERARRLRALEADLQQLRQAREELDLRTRSLSQARAEQQAQAQALARERQQRAGLVAELDQRYQDRSAREQALGQDAKALEKLLANLRAAAAAARAEAERRAAARRAAEAAAAAARSGRPGKVPPKVVANAPAPKVGGLGWPVSGHLLARYGGRLPDGRTSSGVLIAAPAGTAVTAVADGTVVFSDWMTGYGNILIVDHGNGYMSLYAHNDALLREAGTSVHRGEAVARVGNSGGQGVSALYFELRRNGQPVDPSSWLQRR